MHDREKVINGLEMCTHDIPISNNVHKYDFCKKCPYHNGNDEFCTNFTMLMRDALELLKEQEAVVHCRDCKHSEHWYGDKCRCFLWHETGIDVFNDGFCNYGERKEGR